MQQKNIGCVDEIELTEKEIDTIVTECSYSNIKTNVCFRKGNRLVTTKISDKKVKYFNEHGVKFICKNHRLKNNKTEIIYDEIFTINRYAMEIALCDNNLCFVFDNGDLYNATHKGKFQVWDVTLIVYDTNIDDAEDEFMQVW